ncbi:MAG: carboxypeptidase regulatory-like domain-containing protein, partial [Planctomycetes bacterium]|nr:carboxypeptidase regulatory-like domain-containing protein [Planctomycetota bacterium]
MTKTLRTLLTVLTLTLLSSATAFSYVHQQTRSQQSLRWAEAVVTFVIQSDGAPGVSNGSDTSAVREGFAAWGSTERFLELREDTDSAQRARTDWRSDDVHMVVWDETNESGFFGGGSGLIAVTPVDFDPATGEILDADVILDGSRNWSTTLNAGSFDVQAVVTHEVGHFLGLDHSAVHRATMNPAVLPGDTWQRSLETDDQAGADSLYALHTGASLSGTVISADGTPISGAHVVAERRGSPVAAGLSDSEGRYRIQGLPAGVYVVYAEPLNGSVTSAHLQLQNSGQTIDSDFGTTFWGPNGSSSPRVPSELSLAAGSERALSPLQTEAGTPMRITRSRTPWLRPGPLAQHASISGSALSHADTVLIPGNGLQLLSSRVGISTVTMEILVEPQAELGLRSVRLIRDRDDACVVLTGGFEVRLAAPTVTGVTPRSATPGTRVEVSGGNFQAGAKVFVGPSVSALTLLAADRGSFVLPAIPSGTYDLVVQSPDGQVTRLANGLQVTGGSALVAAPLEPATAPPSLGDGSG